MTNLEELERLHAAHLTGLDASTWDAEDGECVGAIVRVFDAENFGEAEGAGNGTAYEYAEEAAVNTAAAAVKCLNALPGLIAELRALRLRAAGYASQEEYDSRESLYLIQDTRGSCDSPLWWRENSCGYTTDLHQAGRYTLDKASRHRGTDVPVRLDIALAAGKYFVASFDALAKVPK